MMAEQFTWEDAIYEAQMTWIEKHFPEAKYNLGWAVDEGLQQVATKIYREGVLTSWINDDNPRDILHSFVGL